MSVIRLQSSNQPQAVFLSGQFVDQYMPQANGEFVKVYICLLRYLFSGSGIDTAILADRLMCTEGDILRALRYWEAQRLIEIHYRDDGSLDSLRLLSPSSDEGVLTSSILSAQADKDENTDPAPALAGPSHPLRKASLTPERVKELKASEEIVQLLFVAEQYLAKTLSASETQKLLLFYDDLHMSVDLIDYLIEYCVSHGHNSMHYIETVALAWTKEGIKTVDMAKKASSRYRKEYYAVLKALGVSGRDPVEQEVRFMDTWFNTYGFSLDLIQEACKRTVISTGKTNFQYADSILSGWYKKKVHSLEDVQRLDNLHAQRAAANRKNAAAPASNRFNNFTQRDYDFNEYERMLLKQGAG